MVQSELIVQSRQVSIPFINDLLRTRIDGRLKEKNWVPWGLLKAKKIKYFSRYF